MNSIKQRVFGAILILCGIASAELTGDGTAAVLLVPLGAYALLTREDMLSAPDKEKQAAEQVYTKSYPLKEVSE